jgi:uncharacterized SAM-binding protein YcdF (DUF218 family)
MRYILLITGLVALAAAIRLAVTAGAGNDTIFFFGIAFALLGYALFYKYFIKSKIINISIALFAFLFIVLIGFIAAHGLRGTVTYREDAVLVLGAGIKGESVTKTLANRLDAALEYNQRNPDAPIIVSGGQGPGEYITEALAMERYLTAAGIAAEMIVKEEQAYSTYTNMVFSKALLNNLFNETQPTVVIVTNDFHMYRSAQFAKAAGITAAYLPAPTPWYGYPLNFCREAAAVIKMWFFGI